MTIYHTFTKDKITYHIIDDFYHDDLLRFGDVYIRLTNSSNEHDHEYFCMSLNDCDGCAVKIACRNYDNERLSTIIELAPDLLENYPELSI